MHLLETQRQVEKWDSFYTGKREGLGCAVTGSCLHEEAIGGLTEALNQEHFMVYVLQLSLTGPKLEMIQIREAISC